MEVQDEATGPPEGFVELVRDALHYLYDAAHLQTHPLVGLAGIRETSTVTSGRLLRQALLDVIEAMRPGPGVSAGSRAWRSYRILELRYIEGLDVNDVVAEVALSSRQYYREYGRALEATASVLWKRWQLDQRSEADLPTRLEAGHLLQDTLPDRVDPGEILRGVAEMLRPLCAQRGVDLKLDLPEYLPRLWGSRVALRQVLVAILSRTIEASDQEVRVTAARVGDSLEILIGGRAAGPADVRQMSEEGRPFVEALRGTLDIRCDPARSEEWISRLTLPTDDRPALLVVDNDLGFIRLVERYLVGYEWEVVGASNADQALALATERRPRAVLLDVVIPGHDGWEVLQALKAGPLTRDSHVIVCSVLDEPSVAISLGATAYLHKPIGQQQLLETLGRLL